MIHLGLKIYPETTWFESWLAIMICSLKRNSESAIKRNEVKYNYALHWLLCFACLKHPLTPGVCRPCRGTLSGPLQLVPPGSPARRLQPQVLRAAVLPVLLQQEAVAPRRLSGSEGNPQQRLSGSQRWLYCTQNLCASFLEYLTNEFYKEVKKRETTGRFCRRGRCGGWSSAGKALKSPRDRSASEPKRIQEHLQTRCDVLLSVFLSREEQRTIAFLACLYVVFSKASLFNLYLSYCGS